MTPFTTEQIAFIENLVRRSGRDRAIDTDEPLVTQARTKHPMPFIPRAPTDGNSIMWNVGGKWSYLSVPASGDYALTSSEGVVAWEVIGEDCDA